MWKNLRLYIYMNIYLFRGKEVGGGGRLATGGGSGGGGGNRKY